MFTLSKYLGSGGRSIEFYLFLFIALICFHCGWYVQSANLYEFMRHGGDQLGYYHWLPGVLLEDNVDKLYWVHTLEDGRRLSLFTLGVAVLQLPFFGLGHLWALIFEYQTDGFSAPYGVAQLMGVALYAASGVVLSFRIAQRYSTPQSALLGVLCLFGATNLFYYSVYEPTMSHLYSFFLSALMVYCWLKITGQVEGEARTVHVVAAVISSALIVLIRQVNVVIFIFPLLLMVFNAGYRKPFWDTLVKHRTAVIISCLIAILPWVLQSMYWHRITDEWITFTYGKKDEHFDFTKMVPGMVLTGVRNGWLIYSPILIAVLTVLIRYVIKLDRVAIAVLVPVVLAVLIYSAWWSWHLGSGYGHRGFVEFYPLLAIPAAWLFRSALAGGHMYRLTVGVMVVALIHLNFGLMERYSWLWSQVDWTWQQYFQEVFSVMGGR